MSVDTTTNAKAHSLGFFLFALLGAVSALTPLAIDLYLPAMPEIARSLNVTPGDVQMTLTAYTIGFAVGQVIYGPLSDSYGRKPILIIGIALFAVMAAVCASAISIGMLTYARVIQGLFGAAAAVVIQAVVRDMFEKEDFSRAMSFVVLVMTVAPLIAPFVGGYLSVWWSWRAIFLVLAVISVVLLIKVWWFIPETLPADRRQPISFSTVLRNYISVLKNPISFGLIISGALSVSGLFAFLTSGAFVYIDLFGVRPEHFGYYFGLNVVALFIMTSVNSRIVKRVGMHGMLRLGIAIQLVAGTFLFLAGWFDWGLWGVVPFVSMFCSTIAIVGSNTMALLLAAYPEISGTVSSLSGSVRFGVGSLVAVGIALVPSETVWPMIAAMGLCAVGSALCYLIWGRKA